MTYKEYVEVCEECGLSGNTKAPFYAFYYEKQPIVEFRTTRDKCFGFYNVVSNTTGAARKIYNSSGSELMIEKENLRKRICDCIKDIKEQKVNAKLDKIKNDF